MSPDELSSRVAQIDGFIKVLVQEARIMDERRYILAPLIEDANIKAKLEKKLNKTQGGFAWNHLPPLLAQDLLRDQSRLLLDDDKRSASLTNVWRKLTVDVAIKAHYRVNFGTLPDSWQPDSIPSMSPDVAATILDRWKEDDRAKFFADFDSTWDALDREIVALNQDPVSIKIRTFRDKRHAHLEMQPLGNDPIPFEVAKLGLTFADIFRFGDRGLQMVADLSRILTGEVWNAQQFAEVHKLQGMSMWESLSS